MKDARKWEAECDLTEAEDVVFYSWMPRMSPPQSIQFVESIDTGDVCHFITSKKTSSLIALGSGIIMNAIPKSLSFDGKQELFPFRRSRGSNILSIRANNDCVCTLRVDKKAKQGEVVTRYARIGGNCNSWQTSTTDKPGNKIAFVGDMLAVIAREFAGINLYTMDGEKVKAVRSGTKGNKLITMTEFDNDSVVIVAEQPSTVIKLKISTETVEWTCDPTEFRCLPAAIHCSESLVYILDKKTDYRSNDYYAYGHPAAKNRCIIILDADNGEYSSLVS